MFDCKLTTWRTVDIGKGNLKLRHTVEAYRVVKLPFVPAPEMRLELGKDDTDEELDAYVVDKVYWVHRHGRFDLEDVEERNIILCFEDEDQMHEAFQKCSWSVGVQQEQ